MGMEYGGVGSENIDSNDHVSDCHRTFGREDSGSDFELNFELGFELKAGSQVDSGSDYWIE